MDCCLGSTYLISTMTGLCKTERKITLWSPSHLFQQISIGLFQQSPVCTEELTPLWIHLQGKGQGEQSVAAREGWGRGLKDPRSAAGRVDVSRSLWSSPHITKQCRPLYNLWRLPRAPALEPSEARDWEVKSRTGPADGSPDAELRFLPTRDLARVALWLQVASAAAAAAAKPLQSCLPLCDPIDGSPPGSAVPGILQARTLERVAISSSNAWKWKVKVKSLSHVWLFTTPWTAAHQAPLPMGFSRQEDWSGVPLPSPVSLCCG